MNVYVVKNADGRWYDANVNEFVSPNHTDNPFFKSLHLANATAHLNGGKVVKMIESGSSIAVTLEEAKMLEHCAKPGVLPATEIYFAAPFMAPRDKQVQFQARMMCAYVLGYHVVEGDNVDD